MYTKKEFGFDLKTKILKREDLKEIGSWAHSIYLLSIDDATDSFDDLLLDLATLELGVEFQVSYEELERLADKIIAGEDVRLYD